MRLLVAVLLSVVGVQAGDMGLAGGSRAVSPQFGEKSKGVPSFSRVPRKQFSFPRIILAASQSNRGEMSVRTFERLGEKVVQQEEKRDAFSFPERDPRHTCDLLLQEVHDFFGQPVREEDKRDVCNLLWNVSSAHDRIKSVLVRSGLPIYVPAHSAYENHTLTFKTKNDGPMGVVYGLNESNDLFLDFQAGALHHSEKSFTQGHLSNGLYKNPYKVITYSVLKKSFSRGIVYPDVRNIVNIAHVVHPQVFHKGTQVLTAYLGLNVPYSYAEYIGPDLIESMHARSSALDWKENFFAALKSQINELHGEGILHNNLSPYHIFVNSEDQPVLGHFGFAVHASYPDLPVGKSVGGVFGYVDPKVNAYCNPIQKGYEHECNLIRKSFCMDFYALKEIACKMGLTYFSKDLSRCSEWMDEHFVVSPS